MTRDDGFEELRTMFAEDLAEKVKALQAALANSNWDCITKISHQIGGTAKSFGFPEYPRLLMSWNDPLGKLV